MEVGKRHVFVCAKKKPPGVPNCHDLGGMDLADLVRAEIYRAGKESEILVTTSGCIGLCTRGPNMIVYPEGIWYTGVKPEEVEKIVKEHLIEGRPIEGRNDPDSKTINQELILHNARVKGMMQANGRL